MPRADKLKLLLLLALFAMPALAAWMAVHVWPPAGGKPYGTLLEPRVPMLAGLSDPTGQPASLVELRGRWVLLTAVAGPCAAECLVLLRLARQARLAQGREQERVARAVVVSGAEPPPLEAGLRGYTLSPDGLRRLHPESGPGLYLLDPLGRLMLRFPSPPDGKGMIGDLRRLLSASRIG